GLFRLHPSQTAAFGDYDNDGWLDLVVGNESAHPGEHPLELFHNNGDGTFTEVAAESGLKLAAYIKGVSWGDFDNDGRIDLFVSTGDGANHLFHNEGRVHGGAWSFRDATAAAGMASTYPTFPTWF